MTKLEMVYLMNVALHLPTMEDVKTFEQINKKATTAIHSLKVNPWMDSLEDIVIFNEVFSPPTCNCNFQCSSKNDVNMNMSTFTNQNDEERKNENIDLHQRHQNLKKRLNNVLENAEHIRNLRIDVSQEGIIFNFQFHGMNDFLNISQDIIEKCDSIYINWIQITSHSNIRQIYEFGNQGFGQPIGMNQFGNFGQQVQLQNIEENNISPLQQFIEAMRCNKKIEFKRIQDFNIFEEEMCKKKDYMKFYPKQVIVRYENERGLGMGMILETSDDFPEKIIDHHLKNVLFLPSNNAIKLSVRDFELIKKNNYNVYVSRDHTF